MRCLRVWVSICIQGHVLLYRHVVGCAAVEDTEADLRTGTMTPVTRYDDTLLTILEHISTFHHLGVVGVLGGYTMTCLSSMSCYATDVSLDQQEHIYRSPQVALIDALQS